MMHVSYILFILTLSGVTTQSLVGGETEVVCKGPPPKCIKGIVSPSTETTPVNLTIGFLGDMGIGNHQRELLGVLKKEGVEMVLHLGDLGYKDDTTKSNLEWDAQVTDVLGKDFPYFAAAGNHEISNGPWTGKNGYQELQYDRIVRAKITSCLGEVGVDLACSYKGLLFELNAVDVFNTEPVHVAHIKQTFTKYPALWRIVGWHKNQKNMQVGGKRNEVGYRVYEAGREFGAMCFTGHEHSYCRSHEMTRYSDKPGYKVVEGTKDDPLVMKEGQNFVTVTGLGGKSIRPARDRLDENPWWARVRTSKCSRRCNPPVNEDTAEYASIICKFNFNGTPNLAYCYYITVKSKIQDEWFVRSEELNKGGTNTFLHSK